MVDCIALSAILGPAVLSRSSTTTQPWQQVAEWLSAEDLLYLSSICCSYSYSFYASRNILLVHKLKERKNSICCMIWLAQSFMPDVGWMPAL
jgi:hypothetical protein